MGVPGSLVVSGAQHRFRAGCKAPPAAEARPLGGTSVSVSEANRKRDLIAKSLWLVAAAMAVHELEEWNIAIWFQRNFSNHTGI